VIYIFLLATNVLPMPLEYVEKGSRIGSWREISKNLRNIFSNSKPSFSSPAAQHLNRVKKIPVMKILDESERFSNVDFRWTAEQSIG